MPSHTLSFVGLDRAACPEELGPAGPPGEPHIYPFSLGFVKGRKYKSSGWQEVICWWLRTQCHRLLFSASLAMSMSLNTSNSSHTT